MKYTASYKYNKSTLQHFQLRAQEKACESADRVTKIYKLHKIISNFRWVKVSYFNTDVEIEIMQLSSTGHC